MHVMNLPAKEQAALEAAKTETEWNKLCDQVKAARKDPQGRGQYPGDWYEKMLASGIVSRKVRKFGC